MFITAKDNISSFNMKVFENEPAWLDSQIAVLCDIAQLGKL